VHEATKPRVQDFVASFRHGYACGWDGVETGAGGAGVAGAVVDEIGGGVWAGADAAFAVGWAAVAVAFGLRA